MLHADIRFVTEMLKHSRYREQVGQRLYAAEAELCRLAGWAAFDSGRHAAAQQYYFAGMRAASAVGDHALAVNITVTTLSTGPRALPLGAPRLAAGAGLPKLVRALGM
jgi:hypothetical protein